MIENLQLEDECTAIGRVVEIIYVRVQVLEHLNLLNFLANVPLKRYDVSVLEKMNVEKFNMA